MELNKLKNILEALLSAADRALTVPQIEALFNMDDDQPTRDEIRKALHEMEQDFADRSLELKQVASGYRLQVKQEYATWVGRLWEEKPARYSRALLETLALIAYRQPITRGEIEEVRGVSVSSNIIRTLLEREWIRVLGHKDVPGKPSLYGTTREFLDYFNLKSLDELPSLAEIRDLDKIHPELALEEDAAPGDDATRTETDGAQIDSAATPQSGDDDEPAADVEHEAQTDNDNAESVEASGSAQTDVPDETAGEVPEDKLESLAPSASIH